VTTRNVARAHGPLFAAVTTRKPAPRAGIVAPQESDSIYLCAGAVNRMGHARSLARRTSAAQVAGGMSVTFRRLALAHFVLAALLFACGHYPPPQPPPPPPFCSIYGAVIVTEDRGVCVFAQRDIANAVAVLEPLGFDRANLAGFVVELHPETDGTSFVLTDRITGLRRHVGGRTDCTQKRIQLARWSHGLPHEVGHAMEGCERNPNADTECHKQHPYWPQRGVCEALRGIGAYEECCA
jgi:hypothetical protein